MEVECGTIICEKPNGQRVKGASACGDSHHVSVPNSCPSGSKRIAVSHNHPDNSPLSPKDKDTAYKHNIVVCVKTKPHGIRCYKPGKSRR